MFPYRPVGVLKGLCQLIVSGGAWGFVLQGVLKEGLEA
jgi:hypothetical protein